MKKSNEIYINAPYDVRLKAPLLKIVLMTLSVFFVPVLLNSLLNGQIGLVIMLVMVVAIMGYCFIALGKGLYSRSASLFIYAMTAIILINGVTQFYIGEHTFALTSAIDSMLILMAVLFVPRIRDLYLIIILLTITYLISIVIPVLTGSYTELTASLRQQLVIPLMSFIVISVLSILVRQIMDRVLSDAISKISESDEKSKKMKYLAQEASERLMLAQSMEKQAEETFVSVKDIDVQIQDIMKNLGILDEKYHLSLDSLNQIGDRMGTLDSVSEKQSRNIQETTTALEEMVASIRSVSDIIGTKMNSVSQLKDSAETGARNISITTESFAQVMEHLGSIKQMITLISGIASKTNLLAMNAAIEAAHAGDAGRGFSVVADEVRKLAETSASSAKQVSDTLKQLIRSIEEAGQNVNNSGETFKSINNEVGKVGMAMSEIEASIKELSIGSNEIIKASTSMSELNSEVINAVKVTRDHEGVTQKNVISLGEFVNSLGDSMKRIDLGTDQIHIAVDDLKGKTGAINAFVKEFAEKLK